MSKTLGFLKTILLPAVISFGLYLLLTYALLPIYHRYRQRYHQYLPLDTISSHTISLRERIADALTTFVLPSSWSRSSRALGGGSGGGGGGYGRDVFDTESLVDDEEGEGMVGFEIDAHRREALERTRHAAMGEGERRLSRDLEEGFRDDSDDEEEANEGQRRR
ncbi:MAG: hypothetical protein M4579_000216 [Chaenotheca gracillima]|nr:MAG: hypothetical protein M4579_000216 [Chaenotheca gracillima]